VTRLGGTSRAGAVRGFSLVELVVATGLLLAVTATVFAILDPAQSMFAAQTEVADMQQRLRVAVDALSRDLLIAGAGPYAGTQPSSLIYLLPPVLPFRQGATSDDPPGTFATDRITIMFVPSTTGQTVLTQPLAPAQTTLTVATESDCSAGFNLCGFAAGDTVLVVDGTGNYDIFTIGSVVDAAAQITIANRPADSVTTTYPVGSKVMEVKSHVYYLKTNPTNQLYQLTRYDSTSNADVPMVEHVVGLKFEYFGEPAPAAVTNPGDAHMNTTYGPAPVAGVANCVFTSDTPAPAPKLALMGGGAPTLVPLAAAELTDGPWCPDGANTNRWDADLLRIRKIAVTLRVEAALAQLRGPASALFTNAGTSHGGSQWVPDQEIRFQIAPRNLNLSR
jgi:Tfp pilus assembly protein PilW